MFSWKRQYELVDSGLNNMKYQNMECKKLVANGAKSSRVCIASLVALICIIIAILLLILFHPDIYDMAGISDNTKDDYTTNAPIIVHNDSMFLLNPTHLCVPAESHNKDKPGLLAVKALVLITSPPKNKELRQAIRETWGSLGRLKESSIRIAFVIGTSRYDEVLSASIKEESSSNKDIVQPDIEDNEGNQSLKSAALLRWAADYCPNAQYIIKAEDNTFVDMDFLLKTLTHDERYNTRTQFISSYSKGMEIEPKTTTIQPFEIDFQNKSEGNIQPYIESTYLIGQCAIQPLKQMIIKNENRFSLDEDLLKQFGIQLIDDERLWKRPPPEEYQEFKGLISAHGYDPLGMRSIWQQFIDDALTQIININSFIDDDDMQSSCSSALI